MTFLVNDAMVDIGIGTASLVALMGYLIVFFGLLLLMLVVILTGKIMISRTKKKNAAKPQAAAVAPSAPVVKSAPGTAGKMMLHDVDPKTAAMAMAIVANKLGKPINELRFKSIKEVK